MIEVSFIKENENYTWGNRRSLGVIKQASSAISFSVKTALIRLTPYHYWQPCFLKFRDITKHDSAKFLQQ